MKTSCSVTANKFEYYFGFSLAKEGDLWILPPWFSYLYRRSSTFCFAIGKEVFRAYPSLYFAALRGKLTPSHVKQAVLELQSSDDAQVRELVAIERHA